MLLQTWFVIEDHDGCQIGRIKAVEGKYALAEMCPPKNAPPYLELWPLKHLAATNREDILVNFFESRADLDAWIAWADHDETDTNRPKVVHISERKKPK